MNLFIEEKYFPFWLVPHATISDEVLLRLRNANVNLQIDREPSGELYIKQVAVPALKRA